jgi:hypothetical protein
MSRAWWCVFLALLLVACPPPPKLELDVTTRLQPLENPFLHPDPFSRNVWDLQSVQNRVLIASGDAWRNTGSTVQKIDVVSYSPDNGFQKEFTTSDEQIHRFVVEGERVLIPGFDPLEDWSLGNFYTLETRCLAPVPCWNKNRTIPFGVHTYDLAEFSGKLYTTIGGFDAEVKPGLLESGDGGQTWQSVTAPELLGLTFTRFFELGGELYATQELTSSSSLGFAKLQNGIFSSAGILGSQFVPDLPSQWRGRMGRIVGKAEQLFYTVSSQGANKALPEALYRTNGVVAQRMPLQMGEYPTDLLQLEHGIAVLAVTATPNGYLNRLYTTTDGQNLTERLFFYAPRFARSVERLGDAWVFGMGCLETEPCEGAGVLYRVEGYGKKYGTTQ